MRTVAAILLFCCLADCFGQSAYLPHRRKAFQPVAAEGGGTPAFVGFTIGTDGSGVTTLAVTRTTTTGNLIVVGAGWEDAARTPTVSDTTGNTYTSIVQTNSGGQAYSILFYAKNITGKASEVITINFGASTDFAIVGAWEISGASLTAPLDQFATGITATGDPSSTHNVTTVQAVEVLCSVTKVYAGINLTQQAGWTEDSDNAGSKGTHFQHFTTSSAGTYKGESDLPSAEYSAICFGAFK